MFSKQSSDSWLVVGLGNPGREYEKSRHNTGFRAMDILAEKLLLAAQDTSAKQICIAGGVAANGLLRETLAAGAKKLGARLYLPELRLCGDNAAMVAAQGFYEYRAGNTAGLNLNGLATLGIDYL